MARLRGRMLTRLRQCRSFVAAEVAAQAEPLAPQSAGHSTRATPSSRPLPIRSSVVRLRWDSDRQRTTIRSPRRPARVAAATGASSPSWPADGRHLRVAESELSRWQAAVRWPHRSVAARSADRAWGGRACVGVVPRLEGQHEITGAELAVSVPVTGLPERILRDCRLRTDRPEKRSRSRSN